MNEYVRKEYGVDFVDTITEAGPDGILDSASPLVEGIRERAAVSVNKHGSRVIAVVGHFDCAGNPVDERTHFENIRNAVKKVSAWFPGIEVVGLWVGEEWTVSQAV